MHYVTSVYFVNQPHTTQTQNFLLLSPKMSQSVRRHSAIVLTVTVNGLKEIHPVIYLLFKLNHN